MSRQKCPSCGNWKYAEAVVCPHCGARQTEAQDPGEASSTVEPRKEKKPLHVSKDEASALLAVQGVGRGGQEMDDSKPGIVYYLVWPQTSGNARVWEIALTILAIPLIGLTLFTTAWWSFRFRLVSTRGLARTALPVSALAAFCFVMAMGTSTNTALITVGGMFLAWLLREILRKIKTRSKVSW